MSNPVLNNAEDQRVLRLGYNAAEWAVHAVYWYPVCLVLVFHGFRENAWWVGLLCMVLFLVIPIALWYRCSFRLKGRLKLSDDGLLLDSRALGWNGHLLKWEEIKSATVSREKTDFLIQTKYNGDVRLEVFIDDAQFLIEDLHKHGKLDYAECIFRDIKETRSRLPRGLWNMLK